METKVLLLGKISEQIRRSNSVANRHRWLILLDRLRHPQSALPDHHENGRAKRGTKDSVLWALFIRAIKAVRLGHDPTSLMKHIQRVIDAAPETYEIIGDYDRGFSLRFTT